MKATEIMLGDWVLMNGSPHQLDAGDLKNIFVNLENDGKDDARYLSPIPLTPEILKKNGFINGEFYAELLIGDWQIMSDCKHIASRSSMGWLIDIPCEYVHELQHALRLCGIEKKIEL